MLKRCLENYKVINGAVLDYVVAENGRETNPIMRVLKILGVKVIICPVKTFVQLGGAVYFLKYTPCSE